MMETIHKREAWNKGKLVGQKQSPTNSSHSGRLTIGEHRNLSGVLHQYTDAENMQSLLDKEFQGHNACHQYQFIDGPAGTV